jgi:hypothetical protein
MLQRYIARSQGCPSMVGHSLLATTITNEFDGALGPGECAASCSSGSWHSHTLSDQSCAQWSVSVLALDVAWSDAHDHAGLMYLCRPAGGQVEGAWDRQLHCPSGKRTSQGFIVLGEHL